MQLAYGHIKDVQVSGSHFQNIGIVNCASVNIIRPTSTFCTGTDIAINDFSLDCAIIDATVNADDWPAGANWTDQYKDDALAVQGYTHGCRIRGGNVRLPEVQSHGGAACIKVSGSSDVIVDGVFCEGHSNTVTMDYSQYTDHPHSTVIVANIIGLNPVNNGLNVWGSGYPGEGKPTYTKINIANSIFTQTNTSRSRGLAGAYLCYTDQMIITGFGTGVTFDSGPHATPYAVSFLGGHIADADTAFHVGNAVFQHSSISDVTITNATTTVAGPGLGELSWRHILQFDVANPHNFSAA